MEGYDQNKTDQSSGVSGTPYYSQQPYSPIVAPPPVSVVYSMQPDPEHGASTVNLMNDSVQEPYTCLYVTSILASLCCTIWPCSFIGLMHTIAARGDYNRGALNLSRKKKNQACCWTAWACGLGWLSFITTIILLIVFAAELGALFNHQRPIIPIPTQSPYDSHGW